MVEVSISKKNQIRKDILLNINKSRDEQPSNNELPKSPIEDCITNLTEVIIVGGGRVGLRLIELLKKRIGYHVTLIDDNKKIIDTIEENFTNVTIVRGDATNKAVLEKAGIKTANIIVAATSIDEVNLLIGITAQNYNLDKIIARTENPSHIKMFKKLGLNEVVSPELTACSDIEKLIIRPNIAEIAISGKGDYELIDVDVKSSKVIGKEIGDISPTNKFMIVLCYKNDNVLIAQNNIVLNEGDKVTVLVQRKSVKKVRKLFSKKRKSFIPI